MASIRINNTIYPAAISGKFKDADWDGRESKTIKLAMTPAEAAEIFVDDASWTIIEDIYDEDVNQVVRHEYDNSDFCVAGDIINHRDGTISVKMGKLTSDEMLEIIVGTIT